MSASDSMTVTMSRLALAELYYAAVSGYAQMETENYSLEAALRIVERQLYGEGTEHVRFGGNN